MPPDHASNPIADSVLHWMKQIDGYILNIGAGASQIKLPNTIEFEYAVFSTTDVVGDAHHLPFKDETFDAVVAMNVFEHLYNPEQAAAEIRRVLKPGGRAVIHTAFLQPLHEEPFHFYNATKYGVMRWFSEFDIETCRVSKNFNPAFTIGWLSSELLRLVEQTYGSSVHERLAQSSLADWSKIWRSEAARSGFLWTAALNLPQDIQERFAAGFELEAVKSAEQTELGSSVPGYSKLSSSTANSIASTNRFTAQSSLGEVSLTHTAPQVDFDRKNYQTDRFSISSQKIDTVRVFVTSLGNYFMIELAQIFVEGFRENELDSELAIDKIPSIDPGENLLQIVVSPHEFFNLFLDHKLSAIEIEDITRSVYMVSGEQPYTPWFKIFCQRSKLAKGIFDITAQTTKAFRERGLKAIHTPLGYASFFEEGTSDISEQDRSIDIVFLGSASEKRNGFLSRHAPVFNRYNSKLMISRLEKPKFAKTAGFYGDLERNRLLRSSKIMVNVHSIDNTYFEWLRAIMCLANRCLFITETSDHIEPLVNGKHLIMADLEGIPAQCEYYLNHEEERLKIVNQAYEFVTQKFSSKLLCRKLLEKL
ncbi:methyltransferase domain-containing protein [Microcoleus sp. FACHB-1515]|uniref:methyltransferase domain-containing protein n=1 Tax=Cyanophyceae TaxID=3028117 RepID=UPI00168A23B4|nr:methyltransferase domain-containing protein [Microcoleus sp. FACHB-1515]MBD2088488.1 methyltransferase domain-containing protein [Microcoleus sp. FACHB-1515]